MFKGFEDAFVDAAHFLKPIKEVQLAYEED